MRILCVILIAFLNFSSFLTFSQETDWERLEFRGKVKTSKATKYKTVEGEQKKEQQGTVKGTIISITTHSFNKNGFLTKKVTDGLDKNPYVQTFNYDVNGNRTEEKGFIGDKLNYRIAFKYDQEKRLIRETKYENNIVAYDQTFLYDKTNLIEKEKKNKDGKVTEKITYTYDFKNNLAEKSVFETQDTKGEIKLSEFYTYKHDINNNLIEMITYYYFYMASDTVTSSEKKIYAYDNKLLMDEIWYNSTGKVTQKTRYTYNKKKQVRTAIAEKYHIGKEREEITYQYSSKGIISEKYIGRHSGNRSTFSMTKYDSKGNWIEYVSFAENDKSTTTVTEQEIEYY